MVKIKYNLILEHVLTHSKYQPIGIVNKSLDFFLSST